MIYKKWAFKLFIYTIILNVVVAFLVYQSSVFNDYLLQIYICAILSLITLILGIIFGVLSYKNKEENDYKKTLGLYGNLGILCISIILQIFGNV